MADKFSVSSDKKKEVKKISVTADNSNVRITALFHSKENYVIELNSKILLFSHDRYYC